MDAWSRERRVRTRNPEMDVSSIKTRMQMRRRQMNRPQNKAHSEMLTIAEVADELRVCDRSVRRWIDAEELPSHRFGRAIRVSRQDLEIFKRARRR